MAIMQLRNAKIVLLDDDDFQKIKDYNWYQSKVGYVYGREPKTNKTVYMHRVIMGAKKGELVDHINHIKFDNRKENLRIATASQNIFYQGPSAKNTSGYVGVSFSAEKKKWMAAIHKQGTTHRLGYFHNKHDAARMYNFWASDMFGEFAFLNKVREAEM